MRLYHYMDGRGDLIEVDEVMIPGIGLGLVLNTTHCGPCIPLEEVPRLIAALNRGLHITNMKERHGNADQAG